MSICINNIFTNDFIRATMHVNWRFRHDRRVGQEDHPRPQRQRPERASGRSPKRSDVGHGGHPHRQKLEASGAIKGYIPVVDPEYFGLGLAAVVAVRISKGKLIETQKRIAQDPHVAAVYDVTGDWDCFIVGRFAGREDLNGFVKGLLAIPHVDRTVTHLVLNVVKEEPRNPPLRRPRPPRRAVLDRIPGCAIINF